MIGRWITKIVDKRMNERLAIVEDDIATRLTEVVKDEMPTAYDVASDMDTGDIASHFDAYDVAQNIDIWDLAHNIEYDDLAREVDMEDIAGYIIVDHDELATYIDTESVANHLDITKIQSMTDVQITAHIEDLVAHHIKVLQDRVEALQQVIHDSAFHTLDLMQYNKKLNGEQEE